MEPVLKLLIHCVQEDELLSIATRIMSKQLQPSFDLTLVTIGAARFVSDRQNSSDGKITNLMPLQTSETIFQTYQSEPKEYKDDQASHSHEFFNSSSMSVGHGKAHPPLDFSKSLNPSTVSCSTTSKRKRRAEREGWTEILAPDTSSLGCRKNGSNWASTILQRASNTSSLNFGTGMNEESSRMVPVELERNCTTCNNMTNFSHERAKNVMNITASGNSDSGTTTPKTKGVQAGQARLPTERSYTDSSCIGRDCERQSRFQRKHGQSSGRLSSTQDVNSRMRGPMDKFVIRK